MEGKKISFGFKKTKKVEKPVVEEKRDFIECLEERAIRVVGGEQEEENVPLVIPLKPNTLITAERLREIAEQVESGLNEVVTIPVAIKKETIEIEMENETLDQMAMRELLQEANKEPKIEPQEPIVPIPAKPIMDGERESTLQDYESVPIQDYGMAMLRGMGWTANKEQLAKYKPPTLRPKGLGLGADKIISDKQKKKTSNKDGKEEELSIVKDSFVKIIAGKHNGYYGKVVSLDEDNGRVMVDITIKKETVSLSEFMMQPVTKAEFDKEAKVINSGAYEEYKKNESSQNQKSSRNDSPKVTEKQRHDSPKVNSKETSSSRRPNDVSSSIRQERREVKEENRRDDKGSDGKNKIKQERSRRNSSNEEDNRGKKNEYRRYSSSSEERRRKDKPRRRSNSSEDRDYRKKDTTKRDSLSTDDRDRRRKKDKTRRDSSSSEDKRKKNAKSRGDSSSEDRNRSNRRKKEKSRRDSSAEERGKKRQETDKKRYSSNESIESISDTEKKKNKSDRRRKNSSDSESEDYRKKDKRDIDKKRKGKKKKRDRDRSPNYKKHRK